MLRLTPASSLGRLNPLLLLSLPEDPVQIGKAITLVTVLDVNDNAPVFATDYETLLCETATPGQVRPAPWRRRR